MSVTDLTLNATGLPVGTWRLDPVHSSASFAVKHMAVATFRGRFERLDATLAVDDDSAELAGTVDASSIVVKDENLQAHLGSPDYFDLERYPEAYAHRRDPRPIPDPLPPGAQQESLAAAGRGRDHGERAAHGARSGPRRGRPDEPSPLRPAMASLDRHPLTWQLPAFPWVGGPA